MAFVVLVLLVWSGLWLILSGVGLFVAGRCRSLRLLAHRPVLAFWLGWPVVIASLFLLNLFLPIRPWVWLPFSIIAILGWLPPLSHVSQRSRRTVAPVPSSQRRLVDSGRLIVFVVLALLLARRALDGPTAYDASLYHLQSVQWARSFSAVPGLANLHSRLGVNSAVFLLVASLDLPALPVRGFHLASGAVGFGALLLFCVPSGSIRHRRVLMPVAFAAVPAFAAFVRLSGNPSPDGLPLLFGVIAIGAAFRRAPVTGTSLVLLATASGVVSNLSFACIAAGLLAVTAVRLGWKLMTRGEAGVGFGQFRRVRSALAVSTLLIVAWVLRSILLSGCLVFPATITRLPLPWSISSGAIREISDAISGWARRPGPDCLSALGSWDWLPDWLARMGQEPSVIVLSFTLSAALMAAVGARVTRRPGEAVTRPGDEDVERLLLLLGVVLVSLGIWFAAAPDLRFAGSLLWLGAGIGWALFLRVVPRRDRLRNALHCVGVGAVALVSLRGIGLRPAYWACISAAPAPLFPVRTMRLTGSLEVRVPATGDRCGEAPIPCTPCVDPRLRLRVPSTLAGGFVLDDKPASVSQRVEGR